MKRTLLAAVVLLAGCGGGGKHSTPTGPTAATPDPGIPAGTQLTILSGETGAPVPDATLVLGGQRISGDAAGQIVLPQSVAPNSPIDILSPAYLDRFTSVRSRSEVTFPLWPRQSPTGLTEDYTANIVYTAAGGDSPPVGAQPMYRIGDGTTQVMVVLAPELRSDSRAVLEAEYACAAVTSASEGRVIYSLVDSAPTGAVRVDVSFDPADSYCRERNLRGYVNWSVRGYEIRGARMMLCAADALYTSTLTHEMGHTFGLMHSTDSREVMYGTYSRSRRADFGAREQLAMRLMLTRQPGNRFPDDGRAATTAARTAGSVRIDCE
jgi:hypothetical protein